MISEGYNQKMLKGKPCPSPPHSKFRINRGATRRYVDFTLAPIYRKHTPTGHTVQALFMAVCFKEI